MSEPRFEPDPILREYGDLVPVCPECGGLVRRAVDDTGVIWKCDLHSWVTPEWIDTWEDDDDDRS